MYYFVFSMCADAITKPLVSVMQPTPAPPSSMEGVQLQQTARGTHKRNPCAYREEGYRVTMETDSPTPLADGVVRVSGAECSIWRDPEMIICLRFPFCVSS